MKLNEEPPTVFPTAKAENHGECLNIEDPDWDYRVKGSPSGKTATIEVFDEDGYFIGTM